MSLKQMKLLKEIATSKTLQEAGLKAGYSKKSRNIYRRSTQEHLRTALMLDKGKIVEGFKDLQDKALRKQDLTNAVRVQENLTRIGGLYNDKQTIDQTLHTQEEQAILHKYITVNRLK